MSFALRRSLAASNKLASISEAADLEEIWNDGIPSSPILERSNSIPLDFMDSLAKTTLENISNQPRKKLHCVPQTINIQAKIFKEKPADFIYRRVTAVSDSPISIPDDYSEQFIYVYNGMDNQTEAWYSFKSKLERSKYGLIGFMNSAFFFENGEVKAKGITGSAQRRLQDLSDSLPSVSAGRVFGFIEQNLGKEKLELYLMEAFKFSVVTPLEVQSTTLTSPKGTRFRTVISGVIFAPDLNWIVNQNGGPSKVNTTTSVLF